MTATVKKIVVPMEERPRCIHPGCTKPGQHMGSYLANGQPVFRSKCADHHAEEICKKYGVNSMIEVSAIKAGFKTVFEYQEDIAKKKGFDSYIDFCNSKHRYRKNRKTFCENVNGNGIWVDPDTGKHRKLKELNCECTATIRYNFQLSVDHINGNHFDDREENHQTLCHNCHKVKSIFSKDNWTNEKKAQHITSINTVLNPKPKKRKLVKKK